VNPSGLAAHRRSDSDARQAARIAIERALDELQASVSDMRGALVASVDGLPFAHNLRTGDPASVAAMASTAAGLGKRITGDLGLGAFDESVVRGSNGYVAVYSAGPLAVLAVIAVEGANLGRVHIEARRCARKIAEALAAPPGDRADER
jgi:predicted regulator of Ras-like GTPase activity (Roadblock/LC7/MglB family)